MSADDTGHRELQTLRFELDLPHRPEKVWRALTDPELMPQWLLPVSDFRLDLGAAFTLRAPPVGGWDGIVQCQLQEIESHRRLSYRWAVPGLETRVTFMLEPTARGTRLTVTQSGFQSEQKRELGGARYGWKMMSARLEELLGRMT